MALMFFVFNRFKTTVLGEDSTNPSHVIRKTYGLIQQRRRVFFACS